MNSSSETHDPSVDVDSQNPFRTLDFSSLPQREIYRTLIDLVIPRPIAWVSTLSKNGISNLAPFSFYNAVSADPPTLMFALAAKSDGTIKDTLRNILETGEFVVNVASVELIQPLNQSAQELDFEVSEIERLGLEILPSIQIKPPRIASSKAQMECKLVQTVAVGTSTLVLGQILMSHVREDLFEEKRIRPERLNPLSRLGGLDYGLGVTATELKRP
jgi:flavin reductase (DIM6/NTAB) family NADH-FMN oxidoreductase RutF